MPVMAPEGADRAAILTVDDDPGVSRAVARDLRRRYGERVPDRARRVRRRGAGRAARDEAARRPGRRDPGRLPDAADERHRVPRAGDGPLPARPAGAADRVRRHRRGDRRDQRGRPRPLPAQAVGPAGGEALPGRRRAARGLAGRGPPRRCPRPRSSGTAGRRRSSEVRDFLARNQVPYRWYASDEPEGERLLAAAGRRTGAAAGGDHPGRRGAGRAEPTPSSPPGSGLATTPVDGLLRPGRHRRRPGRPRRGGLRRVRGSAHRAGRADRDRRPGRARARGSRTTSASPTASPARS